jgi:hypothetical protein
MFDICSNIFDPNPFSVMYSFKDVEIGETGVKINFDEN